MKVHVTVSLPPIPTARLDEVTEFCCAGMREAFDEDAVGFGDKEGFNSDQHINIYAVHCYEEGMAIDSLAISFCPFCGEEITYANDPTETDGVT